MNSKVVYQVADFEVDLAVVETPTKRQDGPSTRVSAETADSTDAGNAATTQGVPKIDSRHQLVVSDSLPGASHEEDVLEADLIAAQEAKQVPRDQLSFSELASDTEDDLKNALEHQLLVFDLEPEVDHKEFDFGDDLAAAKVAQKTEQVSQLDSEDQLSFSKLDLETGNVPEQGSEARVLVLGLFPEVSQREVALEDDFVGAKVTREMKQVLQVELEDQLSSPSKLDPETRNVPEQDSEAQILVAGHLLDGIQKEVDSEIDLVVAKSAQVMPVVPKLDSEDLVLVSDLVPEVGHQKVDSAVVVVTENQPIVLEHTQAHITEVTCGDVELKVETEHVPKVDAESQLLVPEHTQIPLPEGRNEVDSEADFIVADVAQKYMDVPESDLGDPHSGVEQVHSSPMTHEVVGLEVDLEVAQAVHKNGHVPEVDLEDDFIVLGHGQVRSPERNQKIAELEVVAMRTKVVKKTEDVPELNEQVDSRVDLAVPKLTGNAPQTSRLNETEPMEEHFADQNDLLSARQPARGEVDFVDDLVTEMTEVALDSLNQVNKEIDRAKPTEQVQVELLQFPNEVPNRGDFKVVLGVPELPDMQVLPVELHHKQATEQSIKTDLVSPEDDLLKIDHLSVFQVENQDDLGAERDTEENLADYSVIGCVARNSVSSLPGSEDNLETLIVEDFISTSAVPDVDLDGTPGSNDQVLELVDSLAQPCVAKLDPDLGPDLEPIIHEGVKELTFELQSVPVTALDCILMTPSNVQVPELESSVNKEFLSGSLGPNSGTRPESDLESIIDDGAKDLKLEIRTAPAAELDFIFASQSNVQVPDVETVSDSTIDAQAKHSTSDLLDPLVSELDCALATPSNVPVSELESSISEDARKSYLQSPSGTELVPQGNYEVKDLTPDILTVPVAELDCSVASPSVFPVTHQETSYDGSLVQGFLEPHCQTRLEAIVDEHVKESTSETLQLPSDELDCTLSSQTNILVSGLSSSMDVDLVDGSLEPIYGNQLEPVLDHSCCGDMKDFLVEERKVPAAELDCTLGSQSDVQVSSSLEPFTGTCLVPEPDPEPIIDNEVSTVSKARLDCTGSSLLNLQVPELESSVDDDLVEPHCWTLPETDMGPIADDEMPTVPVAEGENTLASQLSVPVAERETSIDDDLAALEQLLEDSSSTAKATMVATAEAKPNSPCSSASFHTTCSDSKRIAGQRDASIRKVDVYQPERQLDEEEEEEDGGSDWQSCASTSTETETSFELPWDCADWPIA